MYCRNFSTRFATVLQETSPITSTFRHSFLQDIIVIISVGKHSSETTWQDWLYERPFCLPALHHPDKTLSDFYQCLEKLGWPDPALLPTQPRYSLHSLELSKQELHSLQRLSIIAKQESYKISTVLVLIGGTHFLQSLHNTYLVYSLVFGLSAPELLVGMSCGFPVPYPWLGGFISLTHFIVFDDAVFTLFAHV